MKESAQARRRRVTRGKVRGRVREQAMARSGGFCEYAECFEPAEEMGHIVGSGAGGEDTLDNVAMLCKWHHDLLDGRTHKGLRRAHGQLLREAIRLRFDLASSRRRHTDEEVQRGRSSGLPGVDSEGDAAVDSADPSQVRSVGE